MIFLFPRWDMLISWRVYLPFFGGSRGYLSIWNGQTTRGSLTGFSRTTISAVWWWNVSMISPPLPPSRSRCGGEEVWLIFMVHNYLGGGFKYFFVHPYLGKWSKLTSIFFRWVFQVWVLWFILMVQNGSEMFWVGWGSHLFAHYGSMGGERYICLDEWLIFMLNVLSWIYQSNGSYGYWLVNNGSHKGLIIILILLMVQKSQGQPPFGCKKTHKSWDKVYLFKQYLSTLPPIIMVLWKMGVSPILVSFI